MKSVWFLMFVTCSLLSTVALSRIYDICSLGGSHCNNDEQCCSKSCIKNACALDIGKSCSKSANSHCKRGLQCDTNLKVCLKKNCKKSGAKCKNSTECCLGKCTNHKCTKCRRIGFPCTQDSDCCNQRCRRDYLKKFCMKETYWTEEGESEAAEQPKYISD